MNPLLFPVALAALLGWQAPLAPRVDETKAPSAAVSAASRFTLVGIVHDPSASLGVVERKKPNPAAPATAPKITDLTFKGGSGAVVPGDLQVPAAPGRKPAVLLLHGLGGNRKQLALLANMLNAKGYVTLCIDAAGHGERPKFGSGDLNTISLEDWRNLGAQTVVDLRRAVDLLAQHPDVDPNRIGYLGASMGGILGARFYSDDPRVKAAVFLYAGADWGKLMTTSQIGAAKAMRDRGITESTRSTASPVRRGGPSCSFMATRTTLCRSRATTSCSTRPRNQRNGCSFPAGMFPMSSNRHRWAWLSLTST